MISVLLLNGLYGMFAGFTWAFALGKQPKSGLMYGVIIGVIIGLLLYLIRKVGRIEGNVTKGEASFMTNMQSTFLVFAAIATGLAAWIIRLIIF